MFVTVSTSLNPKMRRGHGNGSLVDSGRGCVHGRIDMVSPTCSVKGEHLIRAAKYTESITRDIVNIITPGGEMEEFLIIRMNVDYLDGDLEAMRKHLAEAVDNDEISDGTFLNYTTELDYIMKQGHKQKLSIRDIDRIQEMSNDMVQKAIENVIECECPPKRRAAPPAPPPERRREAAPARRPRAVPKEEEREEEFKLRPLPMPRGR